MTDPTIWDNWAPPTTDNEWSREAAESVLGSAGTLRRYVAATIENLGPLTERGVEVVLNLSGNTVRPRLWELQRHGIIELDKEPGVTPSGRKCGRYRITALGRKLLAL